jgi:hypothetical protein
MVDAIPALVTDKAIALFEKFGVFTRTELESRVEIQYESYAKLVNIEARAMIDIASKQIIPAVIKYTRSLADTVNTSEWFFGSLQPCYNKFRGDMNTLNSAIHEELRNNSEDFDAGFYRSIIPGVVSVGAGLLLVMLLMYFILVYYVNPLYRMSDGVDNYRAVGKRHTYVFDGDDQLANINSGLIELIDDNIELKRRVKTLREDREKILNTINSADKV